MLRCAESYHIQFRCLIASGFGGRAAGVGTTRFRKMLSRIPAVSGVSAPSGGCQLAGSRHFGSFRHRLLSSPPRLLASPPRLASSPSRLTSSPPHLLASSPPLLASSPLRLASSPRLLTFSPHLLASPPRLLASSPRLLTYLTSSPRLLIIQQWKPDGALESLSLPPEKYTVVPSSLMWSWVILSNRPLSDDRDGDAAAVLPPAGGSRGRPRTTRFMPPARHPTGPKPKKRARSGEPTGLSPAKKRRKEALKNRVFKNTACPAYAFVAGWKGTH